MGLSRRLQFYGIAEYARLFLLKYWPRPIPNAQDYIEPLRGLHGLEIGGPSEMFSDRGGLPLYREVGSLDGVNFAGAQAGPQKSFAYHPEKPSGKYITGEARHLPIPDASYDFVMSSHVIEHCANPIGAIKEWMRILRSGGYVLIAAPEKNGMFDHQRALTPWSHLLQDYTRDTGEDDPTHIEDDRIGIDRTLIPSYDAAVIDERFRANPETRWVHHHTFNAASVARMMSFAGLDVLAIDKDPPTTVVVLGRKSL